MNRPAKDFTTPNLHDFAVYYPEKIDLQQCSNGISITCSGENLSLRTKHKYKLPLEIVAEVVVCDKELRFYYGTGTVIFNWSSNREELLVRDLANGKQYWYPHKGGIAVNRPVTITWTIQKRYMDVAVDNVLRSHGIDYPYMNYLWLRPEVQLEDFVRLGPTLDNTIVLRSLHIQELE